MIDTNSIAQANQTAEAAKAVVTQWWPTLCLLTALAARELKNFNVWVVNVLEFVIKHGGIGWLAWKLIWNPPAPPVRLQATLCATIPTDKQ